MKILLERKFKEKELPDLLPFPFKPDETREDSKRKKNVGKVPKPSKFIPGEMYHSEYDSGIRSFFCSIGFPDI